MNDHTLTPIESMTLSIAKEQAARGESVPPNTAFMLTLIIERLIGNQNDNYEAMLDGLNE